MANIIYVNKCGKYSDNYAREDLITYMINSYKTQDHNAGGRCLNCSNPIEDMRQVAASFGKDNGVRIHHFVVAFHPSKKVHLPTLRNCAQTIAYEISERFQTFYAIHTDCDHIHFHLVINSVSYVDGKRFRADFATLRWVERIISDALTFCGERSSHYVNGDD